MFTTARLDEREQKLDRDEGEIIASQVKWPATHTSDDQDDVGAVIRHRDCVAGQVYESDRVKIGGLVAGVLRQRRLRPLSER